VHRAGGVEFARTKRSYVTPKRRSDGGSRLRPTYPPRFLTIRPPHHTHPMICPLTGSPHRLSWMRSAWWCEDCRQKIESCCEGACPSVGGSGLTNDGAAVGYSQPNRHRSPART
jgi:hypothetical protein